LEEAYDSPFGGHFGVNKTLDKIRKRFYWQHVSRMLKNGADHVKFVAKDL